MPFCPNCGKEFQLGINFCPNCGHNLKFAQPTEMTRRSWSGFSRSTSYIPAMMVLTLLGLTLMGIAAGIYLFPGYDLHTRVVTIT